MSSLVDHVKARESGDENQQQASLLEDALARGDALFHKGKQGEAREQLSRECPSQVHRQGEHQQGDTPIQTTFPITHFPRIVIIISIIKTLIAFGMPCSCKFEKR